MKISFFAKLKLYKTLLVSIFILSILFVLSQLLLLSQNNKYYPFEKKEINSIFTLVNIYPNSNGFSDLDKKILEFVLIKRKNEYLSIGYKDKWNYKIDKNGEILISIESAEPFFISKIFYDLSLHINKVKFSQYHLNQSNNLCNEFSIFSRYPTEYQIDSSKNILANHFDLGFKIVKTSKKEFSFLKSIFRSIIDLEFKKSYLIKNEFIVRPYNDITVFKNYIDYLVCINPNYSLENARGKFKG